MIINVHNDLSKEAAINAIAFLDTSKFYQVKITCKRGKRSIDQNSLYWMWLTCIEQETGHEKDDLHEYFRHRFLEKVRLIVFGDNLVEKRQSTTKLNTSQFKQYLDRIQVFANVELGIHLPNPEDQKFEQFKDYYSKFL